MEDLQKPIENVKQSQEDIIVGDLNGRTGTSDKNKTVGRFGRTLEKVNK